MRHIKLAVFGLVMVVVIIFGFIFWGDLGFNKQEIAETPLVPAPLVDGQPAANPAVTQERNAAAEASSDPALSQDDDYDDLEKDLNQTNTDVTSDNADIEAEFSGL